MADNITISQGSGTTMATDDVGGVHYQRVKLVSGTLDASDAIGGEATNGLDVDVTRVSGNVAVTSGSATQLDGHSQTLGWLNDSAITTDVGGSVSGKLRGLIKWAFERMPASLGQKTSAASFPVVLASDHIKFGIEGQGASAGPLSGSPVRIGALAVSTEITSIGSGSVTNLIADTQGRLVVTPFQFLQNAVNGVTAHFTDTSAYTVIAAQGSGVKIYLTHVTVSNTSGSASTWLNIKDGSTIKLQVWAVNGTNTPISLPYPIPITANTALTAVAETTGAGLRVAASGFKGI